MPYFSIRIWDREQRTPAQAAREVWLIPQLRPHQRTILIHSSSRREAEEFADRRMKKEFQDRRRGEVVMTDLVEIN